MIGQKLAHFEIAAKLGEGGMGEVYLAQDTKLGRQVAIKVLPEAFVADAERLARFEREAKVLATLNHPNIAGIYEIGEAESVHFLVMELVEGQDLASRISHGPLPSEEALSLAQQIAEALATAHGKGIVHRDLKPANVMIDPDGRAKVLDFGLAKALDDAPETEAALSMSPTLTARVTQAGVILGTAAYMSPEQAEGKPVDARADVFAFGCVLYEMLTGERAFPGTSVADTLSRILRDEPEPLAGRVPRLPQRLGWLLEKCLAKNPAARYQDTRDLVVDVGAVLAVPDEEIAATVPVGPSPRPWRVVAIVAAGALMAFLGGLLLGRGPAPDRQPTRRFEILTTDPQPMPAGGGRMVAISADGMRIAYVDRGQLLVRDLSSDEVLSIPQSLLAVSPFFSPDGEWLFFTTGAGGATRKVWLEGNKSFDVCTASGLSGGDWGENDAIVFSDGHSLWTVQADSTECSKLGEEHRRADHDYSSPQLLPGEQEILIELVDSSDDPNAPQSSAAILSAASGELLATVVRDARDPRYLASGHLAFRRGGTVFVQSINLEKRKISGDPIPVIEDVAFARQTHMDVAQDGTLVYIPAQAQPDLLLVWVDRNGREEALPIDAASYWVPRISPAGDRLAVAMRGSDSFDLAVVDLNRATREVFAKRAYWPAWTPDGEELAFVSDREKPATLWRKQIAGGGAAERLLPPPDHGYYVLSMSVDPVVFTFYEPHPITGRDILIMRPGEDPVTLVATPGHDKAPRLSADARYLSYVTDTSGSSEVYVRTCPPCRPDLDLDEQSWRISLNGGTAPVWSRDGDEIFYLEGQKMMAVPVRTEPDFIAEAPELLFEGTYLPEQFGNANYDVSPDGRFIMIKSGGSEASRHRMNVVVNWFQEFGD